MNPVDAAREALSRANTRLGNAKRAYDSAVIFHANAERHLVTVELEDAGMFTPTENQ